VLLIILLFKFELTLLPLYSFSSNLVKLVGKLGYLKGSFLILICGYGLCPESYMLTFWDKFRFKYGSEFYEFIT